MSTINHSEPTSLTPIQVRGAVLLEALKQSEPCFTFDDVAQLERLKSWPPRTISRTLSHLIANGKVRYDASLRIVPADGT